MRGFHRGWAPCAALALDPFDPRMLWVGTGGNSVFVGTLRRSRGRGATC